MKRVPKTGDEQDAYSKFGRRYLCYLQRSGVRSSIKRRTRRRERREGKEQIRTEGQAD